MHLGVTLKTGGGDRGVRNGFWIGDRGAEGTAVGIQVEDVIDGIIESVVGGASIIGKAHHRRWVDL